MPQMAMRTAFMPIRPSDGDILWSFDAGNTIYSGPVVAPDGTIYFGSTDTKVYAVDPTTHQLKSGWPVVTGGWVIPLRRLPATARFTSARTTENSMRLIRTELSNGLRSSSALEILIPPRRLAR